MAIAKRTKTSWMVMAAIALLILVGVVAISMQRGSAEIGGSIAGTGNSFASVESADGDDIAATPAQPPER